MSDFIIPIIHALVIIFGLMTTMAYMTWFERRVLGRMQVRIGPNRIGPTGLMQPLADAVKLFFKEDIRPRLADRLLYPLAPVISLIAALATFAVIPVWPTFSLVGVQVPGAVQDLSVAVLYLIGASSLGIYGVVLGGWSSGSKYSLLGALRGGAQLVSYELVLGLALVGVVLVSGSLSLSQIVIDQADSVPFIILQPLGFILYFVAAIAETNRAPFDLPEAEQELVAGYHTEYSGFRFALYFIAEYVNVITVSAIAATLFLGGWMGPFWPGPWWLLIKMTLCAFVFVWLRATLPRLRYDQLMRLSWSWLLPAALFNVAITAIGVVLFSGGRTP